MVWSQPDVSHWSHQPCFLRPAHCVKQAPWLVALVWPMFYGLTFTLTGRRQGTLISKTSLIRHSGSTFGYSAVKGANPIN